MQRVDRQLGEYRLLARLAKGGQSEVFLGARGGPHGYFRPLVIKAMPEELKGDEKMEALFYQEAALSSRFAHPHVVTIHDARQDGDDHFMVMDYLAGQTVAELAQRAFSSGEGLSLDEALVIMADACRGLGYVHSFRDVECREYSIVHCDISPQNLMVTYDGLTRVFDFGISQLSDGDEFETTKTDLIGGKYSYMSPEQCRKETLDTRSDIFSLGIILYELVARRRLFRRSSKEEVVEAITEEPIEPPSQVADYVDEELDEVVLKALQRDADDRYTSAGQMAEALEEVLIARDVDVEELRAELGAKVEGLFCEERDEIAEMLREAREDFRKKGQGLAFEPGPSERELELEVELEEVQQKVEKLRDNAERATEVASALSEEVTLLQNRQNWFVAAMGVLALIAFAAAMMAYLSHGGTVFEDEATAQAAETASGD